MTNAELAKLINRRNTLYARIDVLSTFEPLGNNTIVAIKLEYAEEMTRLDNLINEKREYMYNFIGGGWNSEYAHTQEAAIAQAQARWGDDKRLQVDTNSFRESTPDSMRAALSLFY